MSVRAQNRLVFVHLAWVLGTLIVMSALDVFSQGFFFVISFIGFLVFVEYTEPFHIRPKWRTRLRWFIVAGFVVFGYVIVQQAFTVLEPA